MTHRTDIVWLDVNEEVESYKRKIKQAPHSVYPVCEGQIDNIRGILTIKDLYTAGNVAVLKDIMKKPLFIPENNTAYQVLEKFKETQIHAAFIVDEYGTFLGMITLNDILEAIVGDMPETGQDDYDMVKRDDGTYLIDAQIPFYDFLSNSIWKTKWLNSNRNSIPWPDSFFTTWNTSPNRRKAGMAPLYLRDRGHGRTPD